jgi:hypothetical protein
MARLLASVMDSANAGLPVDLLAIFGGSIDATVEESAAAIGGGFGNELGVATITNVLIVDANITASGANIASGIGHRTKR